MSIVLAIIIVGASGVVLNEIFPNFYCSGFFSGTEEFMANNCQADSVLNFWDHFAMGTLPLLIFILAGSIIYVLILGLKNWLDSNLEEAIRKNL